MGGRWADWIAVGLAVAGAAAWLALRIRRHFRRQKEARGKAGACGSPCDGCPLGKDCGGRPG